MDEHLTKSCSEVIFSVDGFTEMDEFGAKVVTIQRDMGKESVAIPEEPLSEKYLDFIEKEKERTGTQTRTGKGKRNYVKAHDNKRRDEVNRKRDAVLIALQTQEKVNYREISRRTGVSYRTIKDIHTRLKITGRLPRYDYNNIHSTPSITDLHSTIEELKEDYYTTRQIKRRHPTFSLKRIRAEIKSRNFRWRKLPAISRRTIKYRAPSDAELVEMARKITYVHMQQDAELLFCDEMKLPLIQTPLKYWTTEGEEDERAFNARQENVQITAIVMCSKERFIAVQFFLGEVNGPSFTNFLQVAINHLPNDKKYLILADNARWHTSRLVQESDAFRFIIFNLPRQYQLNLIENSFSQIRYRFRARKRYTSLIEEFRAMVELFFDQENDKRFEGYYRNHLRNLEKHLYLEIEEMNK